MKVEGNTRANDTLDTAETIDDDTPEFTLDQVREHVEKDNLWLAIDGNVYDVSDFVPRHPGRDHILLGAGIDASEKFEHYHSRHARKLLKKYLIGNLAPSE
eukprot:TRINITY_DN639_c0_g1_i1.p2 TRINITY_DN639_c0_g1~~TRINITY_DN639_c0_g1_i1.p2  ORF type:complete len:101 (-),score=32.80 TRINITY_DN639_c0_g1_i1:126-428(-)